jgi:hypothetical protein
MAAEKMAPSEPTTSICGDHDNLTPLWITARNGPEVIVKLLPISLPATTSIT